MCLEQLDALFESIELSNDRVKALREQVAKLSDGSVSESLLRQVRSNQETR